MKIRYRLTEEDIKEIEKITGLNIEVNEHTPMYAYTFSNGAPSLKEKQKLIIGGGKIGMMDYVYEVRKTTPDKWFYNSYNDKAEAFEAQYYESHTSMPGEGLLPIAMILERTKEEFDETKEKHMGG